MHKISRFLVATAFTLSAAQVQGATIFSDTFDDGDVSDWTFSTNYSAGQGATTAITASNETSVSPEYSLQAYLDKPIEFPGRMTVFDIFVRASHSFTAGIGTHTLDLQARSSPCDGCVISYDILLDGVLLARTSAPNAFEPRSFDLGALAPGSHTLTLGMHTTEANNGRFSAWFDDVVISATAAIPEPATWALMIAGFGMVGGAMRRRLPAPRLV